MNITDVRINGVENPIGFWYETLICSWKIRDTESKKQVNARIEVSLQPDFQTILYKKEGSNLQQSGERLEVSLAPRTTYYYRITVEGDAGDRAVSEIAIFETGKMGEAWAADWISTEQEDAFHPVMTKQFRVLKKVKRARLYVTGVGLFEAFLNGEKLGEEFLTPYVSPYEKIIQVMTISLDGRIRAAVDFAAPGDQTAAHQTDDAPKSSGINTLEILLGKGWYMGTFGLELQKNNYGNRMAAIAELHLEYTDGSRERICTDESWQYFGSDIEESGIYFGEIDNRLLWEGKENPRKPAVVLRHPLKKSHLHDRLSLPVIVKERRCVQDVIRTPAGETVLDMGQNFAGFLEFQADLPRGTRVVLDFGEILQQGNFYHKNYRDAKSQFVYISNGTKETVRPHFTFFGFRYIRVSGWPGEVQKEAFIGDVLYSDLSRTGVISTGNEKINRLYQNTIWGLKSNFIDIPTDCPQRSERLGWTGDAQVFAPTACYHMDTRSFFHKFLKDLREEQKVLDGGVPNYVPNIGHKKDVGSVWGDIATILPDTLYTYYGSLSEVEDCYPLMKDWVDYVDRNDRERQYLFNFGFHFGDWLALDGPTPTSFKGGTDDDYIASVYYCHSAQIVGEMARRLGKEEEAAHYLALREKIKKAIFHEFFTPSGRLAIDTQAAYVIALKFCIYRDKETIIKQFKKRLAKDCNRITCGFVGAPLLCTVLAEAGLLELAYDFLFQEEFPSWLYCVNLGATTVWERWNSVLPDGVISDTGMNSLNHYAYGSVMEFVYAYAAGIRPLSPGFKRAVIEPHPDIRLRSMECRYDSVNGLYVSDWKIEDDGRLMVHVEIPFNCEAEVALPGYRPGRQLLTAGSYDFSYIPDTDYTRPYQKTTTLARIAADQQAMEILGRCVPAIAAIAASHDPEMGAKTLEELSHLSFLPFEPERFNQAIEEISRIRVTRWQERD